MRTPCRRLLGATLVVLLPGTVHAVPAPTHGLVLEDGFRTHSTECLEVRAGLGYTLSDARCSPGGAWGSYLYVSLKLVYDPYEGGYVARLDARGRLAGGVLLDGPGNFAFSAPAGPFGDRLWVDTFTLYPSIMYGFDSTFTSGIATCANPSHFIFDPSGDYDYALYTGGAGGSGGVVRLAAPDACSGFPVPTPDYEAFSAAPARPLAFGPGGDWGNLLYAAPGTVIQPDGSFGVFPFQFSKVTWGIGSRWGGDMFARLDGADPGDVFRVKPDGSSTLFATGLPGELVFCDDSLWIVEIGSCTTITAKGPR